MKNFKQLFNELPSRKVVMAFGRFQPPTIGHALLVEKVKDIAAKQRADHVIFASRTHDTSKNPLPVDKKVYYLKRMFPNTNFVAASEEIRTFIEAAKFLSQRYKNLVMIAGSDRVPEYTRILEKYNGDVFHFETIKVESAGERDPDSDSASGMSGTKMREAAKSGDFSKFKKGLPKTLTELDSKRLMNEIRIGMKLDPISEQFKFQVDEKRELYFQGEIFNIGDKVTDGSNTYEIISRGSNYVSVVNESGEVSKKWIDQLSETVVQEDITKVETPNEISFKGYTTKNLSRSEDAKKAFIETINRGFDPLSVLNALKATDTYMGINDQAMLTQKSPSEAEMEEWRSAHEKARESLNRIGEFMHHQDYWHMHQHELEGLISKYAQEASKEESIEESVKRLNEMKYTSSEKIKVARLIASALGVENTEKTNNPEMLVNSAIRKVRNKPMTAAYMDIIKQMLATAKEAGIEFDEKLVPEKMTEEIGIYGLDTGIKQDLTGHTMVADPSDHSLRRRKIKYKLGEEEEVEDDESEEDFDGLKDKDIDDLIDDLQVDDYLDAYDDEELAIVDSETGEKIDTVEEEVINEVLSRAERIKAKMRFAKTAAKRERRLQIALHTRSSTKKINDRARRMAVKLMKQKIAKKPLSTLSVGEKERIERILQRRKAIVGRIAMKMVPRIRKIENERLSHPSYTKD